MSEEKTIAEGTLRKILRTRSGSLRSSKMRMQGTATKGNAGALREKAHRPRDLTTRLLRDVFNHGEAIHLASQRRRSFLPRARAPS